MSTNSTIPSYYFGLTSVFSSPTQALNQPVRFQSRKIRKMQVVMGPEELEDRFFLALNVAGVNPNDIAVVRDGNDIVVEFEKEYHPDAVAATNWDKAFGIFTRRFQLPENADPQRISYRVEGDQLILEMHKDREARRFKDTPMRQKESVPRNSAEI